MTEVATALKAMLPKSPLPSREIPKWAAGNRMGRTVFEGEGKAKVRARHDGKEERWSWELPVLFEFPSAYLGRELETVAHGLQQRIRKHWQSQWYPATGDDPS